MDNKQRIQIKFNQYSYKYQGKDLNKPEQRLLRETAYGILRSGHVHLTRIGSSLEERIQLKKTCKRFSYHLGKADLHDRLYSYKTGHESPELSENGLILEDLEHIDRHIRKKQIVVIDRGGDRRVLIERFLGSGRLADLNVAPSG
jgi:hypothetical protein